MITAYILTRGEYSDYRILTVCSTKERAESAKRFFNNQSEIRIEEWEMDERLPEEPIWVVSIWAHGKERAYTADPDEAKHLNGEVYYRAGNSRYTYNEDFLHNNWWTRVMAATEEKALKIARDRVAQFRAEQEGVA